MDEDKLLEQVELVNHWIDKAQTDEVWEFVKAMCNIVGKNMREHLDTLPPDERDFHLRLLGTKEQWAADVADGIEAAREAGDPVSCPCFWRSPCSRSSTSTWA